MTKAIEVNMSSRWTRPREEARVAGLFCVVTLVAGIYALVARNDTAGLIAGMSYVVVTLLFYDVFKPVNRSLSAIAAVISLAGVAIGPLGVRAVYPLVFFGVYCLIVGYLVYRSGFLPPQLGVLFAFSSVGWLTLSCPHSPHRCIPTTSFRA